MSYRSYKEYVKEQFNTLLENKYKIECEDNNIQFEGNLNDVVIVVNNIGGTIDYNDVFVQPVVLTFWFNEELEDVVEAVRAFAISQNQTFIQIENEVDDVVTIDSYKQIFNLPTEIQAHSQDTAGFKAMFNLVGNLIITQNVCDIKAIKINGFEIPVIDAQVNYTTSSQSIKTSSNRLNKNRVQFGATMITLTMNNRQNALKTICSQLRVGNRKANEKITMQIDYTDFTSETYYVYVDSSSLQHDKLNPAKLVVVFGLYE